MWNRGDEASDEKALDAMRKVQENMHVQGVSFWAPPNVGPYSQVNKLDNYMLMAGVIGLYPPALALVDPNDIVA